MLIFHQNTGSQIPENHRLNIGNRLLFTVPVSAVCYCSLIFLFDNPQLLVEIEIQYIMHAVAPRICDNYRTEESERNSSLCRKVASVAMCLKETECDVADWNLLGCWDKQFGDVTAYPRRQHVALSNSQWATLVGFCVQIMNLLFL